MQGIGRHHGQQRRQCVGDIVIASQCEPVARHQRFVEHMQHARIAMVVAGYVGAMHRKAMPVAGDTGHQRIDIGAVGGGHPLRRPGRVREESLFVGIVLGHTRIPIEMIGAERGQYTDIGHDTGRVMQLKRRQLERSPRRRRFHECELGHGRTDVADVGGVMPQRAQQMADEGGRGGLAVGAGHGDVAQRGLQAQRHLDFADHGHAGTEGGSNRRRRGRNAGAYDQHGATRDALHIVHADIDAGAFTLEHRPRVAHVLRR